MNRTPPLTTSSEVCQYKNNLMEMELVDVKERIVDEEKVKPNHVVWMKVEVKRNHLLMLLDKGW